MTDITIDDELIVPCEGFLDFRNDADFHRNFWKRMCQETCDDFIYVMKRAPGLTEEERNNAPQTLAAIANQCFQMPLEQILKEKSVKEMNVFRKLLKGMVYDLAVGRTLEYALDSQGLLCTAEEILEMIEREVKYAR
jgi:hypothetical protein